MKILPSCGSTKKWQIETNQSGKYKAINNIPLSNYQATLNNLSMFVLHDYWRLLNNIIERLGNPIENLRRLLKYSDKNVLNQKHTN